MDYKQPASKVVKNILDKITFQTTKPDTEDYMCFLII
jgi:hypothetical protein